MEGLRTYLFVPSNKLSVMEKAIRSNADSVILDLEDAVAQSEKEKARENVVQILGRFSEQKIIFVRINDPTTAFWRADLQAALKSGAKGVFIPKVESKAMLEPVCEMVGSVHSHESSFELIPIIESAKGVQRVDEIASANSFIKTLAFGSIDFSLDVGCELNVDNEIINYARSRIAIATRAAELVAPVDAVYPDLNDQEGLFNETKKAKSFGFRGKMIIHPKQIDRVHEGLRPSDAELEEAKTIVQAFEDAEQRGLASISVNNKLVDYPVYKRALILVKQIKRN